MKTKKKYIKIVKKIQELINHIKTMVYKIVVIYI